MSLSLKSINLKKQISVIVFVCLFNLIPAHCQVNLAQPLTYPDFNKTKSNFMGAIGVSWNASGFSGGEYIGLEGAFSFASFGHTLNLEISIRPSFLTDSYDGQDMDFICPIILAPRLNICRVARRSFYLYLQPEIGYAINADYVYGGRLGLGWRRFGTFYVDGLACTKLLGEGTKFASNFLFFSFGYSYYFW